MPAAVRRSFAAARVWFLSINFRRALAALAGLGALLIVCLLPQPEGLSAEGQRALALLAMLIIFWATEPVPLPVTAFMAGIGLVLLRVQTPDQAFTPYARSAVFFILGALILAQGLSEVDLDRRIAARLLATFGRSFNRLLAGVLAVTALLAAFMPDHTVAAIMMPVLLTVVRRLKVDLTGPHGKALLLGMALAAGMAGLSTPSGGARNAIVLSLLREDFDQTLSYGRWLLLASPITILLVSCLYLFLRLLFRPANILLEQERRRHEPFTRKQFMALTIFALTVILWLTVGTQVGLGTVAMIGAVLMYVTGTADWEKTRGGLSWGIIFIYGAALSIGSALEATGGAGWLAGKFLGLIPGETPIAYLTGVLILTSLLAPIMGAGPTAGVMAPITLSLASEAGIPPVMMGLTTAVGCAFSFLMVVGTPPLVITYASGAFTSGDLRKVGIPCNILAIVITVLAINFYWRYML